MDTGPKNYGPLEAPTKPGGGVEEDFEIKEGKKSKKDKEIPESVDRFMNALFQGAVAQKRKKQVDRLETMKNVNPAETDLRPTSNENIRIRDTSKEEIILTSLKKPGKNKTNAIIKILPMATLDNKKTLGNKNPEPKDPTLLSEKDLQLQTKIYTMAEGRKSALIHRWATNKTEANRKNLDEFNVSPYESMRVDIINAITKHRADLTSITNIEDRRKILEKIQVWEKQRDLLTLARDKKIPLSLGRAFTDTEIKLGGRTMKTGEWTEELNEYTGQESKNYTIKDVVERGNDDFLVLANEKGETFEISIDEIKGDMKNREKGEEGPDEPVLTKKEKAKQLEQKEEEILKLEKGRTLVTKVAGKITVYKILEVKKKKILLAGETEKKGKDGVISYVPIGDVTMTLKELKNILFDAKTRFFIRNDNEPKSEGVKGATVEGEREPTALEKLILRREELKKKEARIVELEGIIAGTNTTDTSGEPKEPEKKERKRPIPEKFNTDELEEPLKTIMREALEKKEDADPEIKDFEVTGSARGFVVTTTVKARTGNVFSPTVSFDMSVALEDKGAGLELGAYKIDAGMFTGKVKREIEPALPSLIPMIKNYFEKRYGTTIESMKVEGGQLVMGYKKT